MAPTLTNYENIVITLCLMSIVILRRRLRDRARGRRRATRSWLLRRKQRSAYNALLRELHEFRNYFKQCFHNLWELEPFFRAYNISLQFFDKDDKKTLIATTDTLSKFSLSHEALPLFIENVLRSTLSYPNETSKECIQFLNEKQTTWLAMEIKEYMTLISRNLFMKSLIRNKVTAMFS
jgi:hypothetical protein